MKIYCDNGACPPELKELQKKGCVELYMFKYENKNRHVPNSGFPSKASYTDLKNYSWADLRETKWSDFSGSEKYDEIVSIIGLENNRVDIMHLDSAYKSQCKVFMTNDKHGIWSKRSELEAVLGMRIFYTGEIDDCVEYIRTVNNAN